MIKAKGWNGKALKGEWEVTTKIDGVRMLRDEEGNPVSRSGKPLYNLQDVPAEVTDAEIFLDDWETSVSRVRTKDGEPVTLDMVYSIDPVDPRLVNNSVADPLPEIITDMLAVAVACGWEGLVLRQGNTWLKVKTVETYDVEIEDLVEGSGKCKGMLGAMVTSMGKVGTGFTDAMRKEYWDMPDLVGTIIEVECMELTKDGKFRHPRFKRLRFDK